MSRFDQNPDEPYAVCEDCGESLADRAAMSAHFAATRPAGLGSSHRVRITNMERSERIERQLDSLAEDAVSEFVDKAFDLITDGVTEEEITAAVRSVTADFADGWARRDS